ncbi:hypothetical protein RIF29_22669 [Crotalaria pallida]|uniref:Uncharacterized protein n=1 Tax=Crotalaria pallida TaxID=3830 RepID=A0AAN9FDQ2_CROPI
MLRALDKCAKLPLICRPQPPNYARNQEITRACYKAKMGWNMSRKVRPLCVSAILLLLFLQLQLPYEIEARSLEVKKFNSSVRGIDSNSTARTSLWTMLHSGPSPGGKGHKSRKMVARVLRKLTDSGPSPGIGH